MAIEAHLDDGELQEVWQQLKGWYCDDKDRAPQPCFQTVDKQTLERMELYRERASPGDPISINVDPFEIQDEMPDDDNIRGVVKGLKNGRAGGASKIRTEDMKMWLCGMRDEEEKG